MAKARLHVLLFPLLLSAILQSCRGQERKVYIVYTGELRQQDHSTASTHHSMLETVLGSTSSAKESLIYSYGRSFSGFAAKLTSAEVAKFRKMEGVISVIPNKILQLHTTRSWDFMGFTKGNFGINDEGNVIIGVLDTGIWPESDSFSDEGLRSPPRRWKGTCQGANFTCNNKIIGARYYNSEGLGGYTDYNSPRDFQGHGTHTSSTAAGRKVPGASYFGLAEGKARGGVPGARIAVYKVCWPFGCSIADILAAFDDAIADGVDVLSVSLGYDFNSPYFEDPIAIGSFHAMKRGILTACSAGNSGPIPYTVTNLAPWILTVGASTIDRKFVAQVVLGNGQVFNGLSINRFNLNGESFPLIWGGDAANYSGGASTQVSKYCIPSSLNSYKVGGKIVLCDYFGVGNVILKQKGIGTIMADSSIPDVSFSSPLPSTVISTEDGLKILDYIRSNEKPIATILGGETWKDVAAPYVASFSSRGPNFLSPDILKPDLVAPGVGILAAWSPWAAPSKDSEDTRSIKFNIVSGTSMSCPHASGAAAYVKAAHPTWSPAAIKSALMTTAIIVDPEKHEDLEFAYGSGHINPLQAAEPGLVYDVSEEDYIGFLCKQGYSPIDLQQITGENSTLCKRTELGRAWDLNYPSFSVAVEDGQQIQALFTRTVTNVGSPNHTYTVSVYMPSPATVMVEPSVLSFSAIGEKKSFTLKVDGPSIAQQPIMSGGIVWQDGVYKVRSPVVVYTILPGAANFTLYGPRVPNFKGSSMYHKNGILGHQ